MTKNSQPSAPLSVLFRDEHYIAVNKPSGLLVHRSPIARHETEFALQSVRDQIGQRVYTIHRLDRPTSGVLLFALSQEAARLASAEFETGRVTKRYLAIVRGFVSECSTIDYALTEIQDDHAATQARPDTARSAVTHVKPIGQVEIAEPVGRYATARYSLVSLTPETGRRHQLRRHLKHIFHPILGDTTYGDGRHNRFFRQRFDSNRLLLHAQRLRLTHPLAGAHLCLNAPLDLHFASVIEHLGLTLS
jgi:tRNA pseudouridine65 synthase